MAEHKIEAHKTESKMEEQKTEIKAEETKKPEEAQKEEKKKIEVKKVKKNYAAAAGINLPVSTKEAADICSMIRGRNIDRAIKMIEDVIAFKRVVKMNKREVPHQHGKGVMAGRYPIKACKGFLVLLKNLKANGIYNELELEKYAIVAMANQAGRPYKRGGARFKRSHVSLRLEASKMKPKAENKSGGKVKAN